jgi:hypothetical protein
VQTNDPTQPSFTLVVTGKVLKFVAIRPTVVRLEGQAGTTLTAEVEIQPNKDYPFTILGVRNKTGAARGELIEQCNSVNNRCVIRVEIMKSTSGRHADSIIVQTDNGTRPEFSIPVVGILH